MRGHHSRSAAPARLRITVFPRRPSAQVFLEPFARHQCDEGSGAGLPARHGWTAKLAVSILTNFREFAVYDCLIEPNHATGNRWPSSFHRAYQDYLEQWDEIAGMASPRRDSQRFLRQVRRTEPASAGRPAVDASFLEGDRKLAGALAREPGCATPSSEQRGLNFAVQRTIDRIIFLRICEDRGIEAYGRLRRLLNRRRTSTAACRDVYEQADDRYNSGLFHFHAEKDRAESARRRSRASSSSTTSAQGHPQAALLSPKAPTSSPSCPAEILGQVYEQFLGKVIRLTAGHQAKVEGEAGSQKSRRRLLHARPTSSITSSSTPSANCSKARRPQTGRNSSCGFSTPPAAPARS